MRYSVLLILTFPCLITTANSQTPASKYYKQINLAEQALIEGDLESSVSIYENAFETFNYPFSKHIQQGFYVTCYDKNKRVAELFLRKSVLNGIIEDQFSYYNDLWIKNNSQSKLDLDFDSLRCESMKRLDTASMFSEIRGLKNDSLINSYWEKLSESDQDIGTFGSATVQIENWLKCITFFKEFGFTKYQYHDTLDKTLNNFCMYAKIIWMHSPSIDLNIQSYSLINKLVQYDLNFEWNYLNQKIFFLADTIPNNIVSTEYINNNDDINEINMNDLVRLGNEYIAFRNSKNQVIGKWKVGKFCLELTKTEDEKYFLEYLGSLKRVYPLGSKKYAFDPDNQETNISILTNRNLLLNSKTNKIKSKEFDKI